MLRNLLLTSLRGFKKNSYYTFVNTLGLGIGMACFILLIHYISFERSYDSFHENKNEVYRIASRKIQNGVEQNPRAQAPVILKGTVLAGVPEVESAFRIHPLDAKKVTLRREVDGEYIDQVEHNVYHGESDFFNVLDFELIKSTGPDLLDRPYTVVLSESMASKLFGDIDPVGKSIRIIEDFDDLYLITGVMKDLPVNTHFNFNLLISFETFRAQHPNWRWTAWDWDYFFTYVKLRQGSNAVEVQEKIQALANQVGKPQFDSRNYEMQFTLQPLPSIHLNSHLEGEFEVNGEGTYLNYLYGAAFAVLLLAWINFINLSVARTMQRAAEVGIRSSFGANKWHLAAQLVTESLTLHFIAAFIGITLIVLGMAVLPAWLGISLSADLFDSTVVWKLLFSTWAVGAIITIVYPIILAWRFQPRNVLRGKLESSKYGAGLWRWLVVTQYSLSLILIILTMVVTTQLDYLKERDLGISLSQTLSIYTPNIKDRQYWNKVDQIRSSVKEIPGVTHMTSHSYLPGENLRHVELVQREGGDRSEAVIMKYLPVDYEYFSTFDIDLIAGRDFTVGDVNRADTAQLVGDLVLNEAAIRALGFENPEAAVAQPIELLHSFGPVSHVSIRGVVSDFDQLALDGTKFPMAFVLTREGYWWSDSEFLSFRLESSDYQNLVSKIESVYREEFPEESFQYFFVDDYFNQAYQSHVSFGNQVALFSAVATVLALFGLVGISMHTVNKKLKEIAVRKVHGASVSQIFGRLAGQIMVLVVGGFLVAVPLSFWFSRQWLDGFQDRTNIDWLTFAIPLIWVVAVSLIAVFYNTIKAAFTNPVETLRNE
ncbi:MAG: ABC transporter permease [Cyclobacteriaceae bacterium]|nr:ABC transporter permease [Cyclobacteriaceae bacterium]